MGWIAVFMPSFLTVGMVIETLWKDPETVSGEDNLVYAIAFTAVFARSFAALGGVEWLLLRRRRG